MVFLVLVLSHSRRDLSRGEKKGKKEEKQSAQTRKKNKKPISLHFNNALVLFTRVRNNKRANVS